MTYSDDEDADAGMEIFLLPLGLVAEEIAKLEDARMISGSL
jgi:hypothetical protein